MSNKTTNLKVFTSQTIKALQETIARRKTVNPSLTHVIVSDKQYSAYCAAIKDPKHAGNPYWNGVEIKKRGNL